MPERTPISLSALMAAALLVMALGTGASQASERDHDRARQALEAGEILPLRTILDRVERDYPGQIMEVELEREPEGWRYEIKLLRKGGALIKLEIDARSGEVLGIKNRKGDAERAPGAR